MLYCLNMSCKVIICECMVFLHLTFNVSFANILLERLKQLLQVIIQYTYRASV